MKKSIVFFLTVIMLLGIISCSNEQPTKVTGITFKEETFNVSSVDISNHGEENFNLVVESMTPSSAENKKVTYALKEKDESIPGFTDGTTWKDVVTVSEEDGIVTFNNTKDLSNVHSSVTITASCGTATTDITFKLNLEKPKDINLVFGKNDVYSTTKDGTLIVDLITNGEVKLGYAFETCEDPSVTYSDVSDSKVISLTTDKEGITTITAIGSGYQEVTVSSKADSTVKPITFGVYVNAVRTADDLKAFLNDDTTADTGNRKKQLNAATSAYIVNDINKLTTIKTNLESKKELYLNGKALSFTPNSSNVGFDLSEHDNQILFIYGENSKITLDNSYNKNVVLSSATLFKVGKNFFVIFGGLYDVCAENATVVSSESESDVYLLENVEFIARGSNVNALHLGGCAELNKLKVTAAGANYATALSSSGTVQLSGGSFTVISESGNVTALDLNNCHCIFKENSITVNAKSIYGRATGISSKGADLFRMSDEISGVSTINAYGSSAVGLICDNLDPYSLLHNIKVEVVGTDDSSDKIVKDFSVIGMLCNSDVYVSGDITVNVSTSTRISEPGNPPIIPTITSASKNLCAVYNAKTAEMTFRGSTVNVSAVAERGGAYALYNEGSIEFRGADSTFTASRKYDVINNQDNTVLDPERNALLYSLYNEYDAEISISGGSMRFISESPNMVDCTYLNNGTIHTNKPVSFETLPYSQVY